MISLVVFVASVALAVVILTLSPMKVLQKAVTVGAVILFLGNMLPPWWRFRQSLRASLE
ncbi:hypothetical protein [Mesorhizobium sp. M0208]|uniref:hypothetical protein n=1 Tax=unclassified Mesorhizobium TaxID=325217 RepID=UPI00333A30AA